MGRLDELDLSKSLSRKEEAKELQRAWERLTMLRLILGGQIGEKKIGPPVCAVFEGWDASGKGGAIKRLVAQMDPRHVRVVQFAAPSADEKRAEYAAAVEDMLARTDQQPHARWHLIEGDSKRYARVKVIRTVIDEIEEGMRRHGIEPPPQ